jgi:hypothetical protein
VTERRRKRISEGHKKDRKANRTERQIQTKRKIRVENKVRMTDCENAKKEDGYFSRRWKQRDRKIDWDIIFCAELNNRGRNPDKNSNL